MKSIFFKKLKLIIDILLILISLMENDTIFLVLPDDETKIKVRKTVAKEFFLIQSMLEDCEDPNPEIPIMDKFCTLKTITNVFKCAEWMINNPDQRYFEQEFYQENPFNDDDMFELIRCIHYLDHPTLLDDACRLIAENIKSCKDPEEIRERFNIENDFTPEEIQKMESEMEEIV
jgi:S-phase kinase-associated protein 1